MNIELKGRAFERLAADLMKHRERYALNDSDYAGQVLRVSLNTLKKCLRPSKSKPLVLKRQTLIAIFAHSGLDPSHYGLSFTVPSQAATHGGYQRADFAHLCGAYYLYRRDPDLTLEAA